MTAPVSDSISNLASGRRTDLVALGSTVQMAEDEMVPAVLTFRVGRFIDMSVPVGAFVVREGKPCFVHSVDVVGLAAVTLGIGVGWFSIWKVSPIIRALAERIRPT